MNQLIDISLGFGVVMTGLMAGVYFAFSVFIMAAFKGLPDDIAIKSMNSINRVILKSGFMPMFFISTLIAVSHSLYGMFFLSNMRVFLAGTIYFIGMFLCAVMFNVPLNNRLRDASHVEASSVWQHYLVVWTRWNHVRVLSSIATCSLYLIASSS